MSSLSSERFASTYNANSNIRTATGPSTPRRSMKIDHLLNDEESSPQSFPLFLSFTTETVEKQMALHRPITPFELARPITPLEQVRSSCQKGTYTSFTPRPKTPFTTPFSTPFSSRLSTTPLTRVSTPAPSTELNPLSPVSLFDSPKHKKLDPQSFEAHTGVLDFRPLEIKLINTTSSESKLLNFDLSPTSSTLPDLFSDGTLVSSKSVNFYTSRFILNPNLFKNRKFQCRVCDKRFKTTGHLTRHKKIHSGEKKFECSFEGCSSRFSRKDNCMQHYRTHFANKQKRQKTRANSS